MQSLGFGAPRRARRTSSSGIVMRINALRLGLALSLGFTASAAMAQRCGQVAEPAYTDLCAGLSRSTTYEVMNRMDKPEPLEPVVDRSFGSRIIRISDAGSGGVVKPMYSTVQAWNADESLLLLYSQADGKASHEFYDGRSYAWRGSLGVRPGDIEQVFWHATDPNILFYVDGAQARLMRYAVDRRRAQVLHDFNELCGGERLSTGGDTQMPSWDSRYIGLRCGGGEDSRARVMVFDTVESAVVADGWTGVGDGGGDRYNAWTAPAVAPSGERLYFQGDVSDLRLRRQRVLALADHGEHSSLGQLPDGRDAYYAVGFDVAKDKRCDGSQGALVAHDLQSGDCQVVIGPSTGHGYPPSGTHLSALAYRNPGWVALSSVGEAEKGFAGKVQRLFHQEIYLAYADPERPRICRVAHHRSQGRDNKLLRTPYFAEPHVGISPSGTRLIFGSDWHGGDSVDTYVVELPAYTPCEP